MSSDYEELEQRWIDRLDRAQGFVSENSRLLLGAAILAVFGVWAGVFSPDWPTWWPIVPIIGVAALVAGYFASDKIYALMPDEPTVLLVTLRADEPGGEVYELSEDEFGNLFVWGDLYQWPQTKKPVYEARSYDPDSHTAVGNWRESMPASAFLSEQNVEDAMTAVRELRQDLEPEAAKAKELRRRFRGIARKIDAERTQERFREIDKVSIDRETEGPTVGEIVDESMPENLHPHAGMGDRPDITTRPETNGHKTNGHTETDETGESDTESESMENTENE